MDFEEDAILIAIDVDRHDLLPMAAFLTFSPQSISASAEVGSESTLESLVKGLLVHPSHHEDLAAGRVLGDCRKKSTIVCKFWVGLHVGFLSLTDWMKVIFERISLRRKRRHDSFERARPTFSQDRRNSSF